VGRTELCRRFRSTCGDTAAQVAAGAGLLSDTVQGTLSGIVPDGRTLRTFHEQPNGGPAGSALCRRNPSACGPQQSEASSSSAAAP
jgi:hypothetical protein